MFRFTPIHFTFRGQPVVSKQKEDSEVGVVSTVAIYSLKAKLGKLETETQTLNENLKKLEKEKSTLSLLNTEARYTICLFVCLFVCFLLFLFLCMKLFAFFRNKMIRCNFFVDEPAD